MTREITSVPTATYRLQLTGGFTLFDAAALVPHLADLGVSHVYCSPWLASAPGSSHGYDVVDHSRVDEARGGAAGVQALADACREHGLGIVLDLVPNHMFVGAPEDANAAWTDVLTTGESGAHGRWFDVDWSAGPVRLPIAGDDGAYGSEHHLPEGGPWVAVPWREGPSYRRFFDVDALGGLRVEDSEVLAATHALVADQVRSGLVQGLRIDHPDGLADPGGYLEGLAELVPGTWTVVEKILEGNEKLPSSWPCEGTTGYDAMLAVTRLFTDPAGQAPLEQLVTDLTGVVPDWEHEAMRGKREVVTGLFEPELRRLTQLASVHLDDPGPVQETLAELLALSTVYRSYGPDDAKELLGAAVAQVHPSLTHVAEQLLPHLCDDSELATRFRQTSGPVMAKGIEDTACYRHLPLLALNEVGGDPGVWGLTVDQWHEWCLTAQTERPWSMTASTTHDTKRSADVRARLLLLSELPASWAPLAGELTAAGTALGLDAPTAYIAAQTMLGAWPLRGERLAAYLGKATKEAKQRTSWRDPDPAYDQLVQEVGLSLPSRQGVSQAVEDWLVEHRAADELAVLAATLASLMMPGVPDVYQGCEVTSRTLVDPDNRMAIDVASLRADTSAKKSLVRSALRLRRAHPDSALGPYEPLELDDDRFVGWRRGRDFAVVLPRRPAAAVGAQAPAVEGFGDVLGLDLPVALLVRES